jgi:hypothetical protein
VQERLKVLTLSATPFAAAFHQAAE